MSKRLCKIVAANFGHGGYQDCQLGLWITLSGEGVGITVGITGG
jgi:hypothetical protein